MGGIGVRAKLRLAHHYSFGVRSEEHTSELQSQSNLVCRLLLEKKHTTFFSRHGLRSWLSSKTRIVSRPTRGPRLRFTTSSVRRRTVQRERPSGGGPHTRATVRT